VDPPTWRLERRPHRHLERPRPEQLAARAVVAHPSDPQVAVAAVGRSPLSDPQVAVVEAVGRGPLSDPQVAVAAVVGRSPLSDPQVAVAAVVGRSPLSDPQMPPQA